MAVSIDGISVCCFRSYLNDQAMLFPSTPGLYMLAGDVGHGKSSMFEAVRWALTGSLSTGLRAKQVAHWDAREPTIVALDLLVDRRLTNITRRYNPNSLTLQQGLGEPRVIEQPEIDRIWGVPAAHIMNAVFIAQRAGSFMSLGATKQGEWVSRSLGLLKWDERVTRAKDAASKAQEAHRQASDRLVAAKAALQEIEQGLRLALTQSKAFKADLATRLRDARLKQWVVGFQEYATEAIAYKRWADAEVETTARKLKAAERRKAATQPSKVCNACGQPMPNDKLAAVRSEHERACEAVGLWRDKLTEIQGKATRAAAQELDANKQLAAARAYVGAEQRDADIEEQLTAIAVEVPESNPYREQIKKGSEKRKAQQAAIAEAEKAMAAASRREELAKLAVRTFPQVKLSILEEACVQLTTDTNNAFSQLGLKGWAARWSTVKELDGGELRAKFTMVVKAPGSPDWVDFRAWSGGESVLLKAAGAAAYIDLVRSRIRNAPDFEFWDEASSFLNEEEGRALMGFLRHRAHVLKRKVWVVDHHTQFSGLVDKVWRVSKTATGSVIKPG